MEEIILSLDGHTVDLYKQAMGNYPTGVTVVTAIDENGEPIGLTVNSFASVSIDPILVLWSIDESVSTYSTFKNIDKFAVNILSSDQKDLAFLFASREQERFINCEWTMSDNGLPMLTGALATLQCKTHNQIEIGDHTTLFGEVIDIHLEDTDPLLYHKRKIAPFPQSFHANEHE